MSWALFAIAVVSWCGGSPQPPQDCKIAGKEALRCAERNDGRGDLDVLLACFPFSKSEPVVGAWVFGFETNHFFEGEQASPEHLKGRVSATGLEPGLELGLDTRPKAYQVEFIGRRSRCDMGLPSNIILVEKVISKRELLEN